MNIRQRRPGSKNLSMIPLTSHKEEGMIAVRRTLIFRHLGFLALINCRPGTYSYFDKSRYATGK